MQLVIPLLNAFLSGIVGFYVGRLMAMTVHYLPLILLEGCDQGREPRDIFTWFLQRKNITDIKLAPFQWGIALLFGLSTLLFGVSIPVLFVLVVSCLLICCFFTDYEHGILPDQLTLTLVWIGLIGSLNPVFVYPSEAILGAVGGYGIFWMFNELFRYFRHQEGMYPGDFKLNAGIGACIGFKFLIPVLIISFVLLIVVTLGQHLFRKEKGNTSFFSREVPYACFVTVIIFVAIFFKLINPVPMESIANLAL
jgi:prepilin signal peptidase PulO-like enzyme (type II secretory pathway)